MRTEVINIRLLDAAESVLDILQNMETNPMVKSMITVLESALKPVPFRGRLSHIPLNLQQGLVWTNQPEILNTVVAVYDKHREVLIIRPEYKDEKISIISVLPAHVAYYDVLYGDSFNVDTWDLKIKKHV